VERVITLSPLVLPVSCGSFWVSRGLSVGREVFASGDIGPSLGSSAPSADSGFSGLMVGGTSRPLRKRKWRVGSCGELQSWNRLVRSKRRSSQKMTHSVRAGMLEVSKSVVRKCCIASSARYVTKCCTSCGSYILAHLTSIIRVSPCPIPWRLRVVSRFSVPIGQFWGVNITLIREPGVTHGLFESRVFIVCFPAECLR